MRFWFNRHAESKHTIPTAKYLVGLRGVDPRWNATLALEAATAAAAGLRHPSFWSVTECPG